MTGPDGAADDSAGREQGGSGTPAPAPATASTAADREIVGQVVGGSFGDIIVRQKAGKGLEIGSILVSRQGDTSLILQVFALEYGSQIGQSMQEMMSGQGLEDGVVEARPYEPELVNYVLARIKPLARVRRGGGSSSSGRGGSDAEVTIPKAMPPFFGTLSDVTSGDLDFVGRGDRHGGSIMVGYMRSGTRVLEDVEVRLPAEDVFSHHVLIPATTGRGKSNLVKTMMWHALDSDGVGALVLDAHDEYYGRHGYGLKDHPRAAVRLAYYTPASPPAGAHRLTINLSLVEPSHFEGIVEFSDAQLQALRTYRQAFGRQWISRIMTVRADDLSMDVGDVKKATLTVVRRKMRLLLGLSTDSDGNLISRHSVFDATTHGTGTVETIVGQIREGRVVVLDTSRLGTEAELLVGNIIATSLFEGYRDAKATGDLDSLPVAAVVIEEAPRVIGSDVLKSDNESIYATIAKEGRKFKVGLVAITQLSSVIPKTILANMNTKIILGNEMKQEREALIASASQDLSEDDRNIAGLDKGEAIVSSIFVPFATPVKIPLFDDLVRSKLRRQGRDGPPGAGAGAGGGPPRGRMVLH